MLRQLVEDCVEGVWVEGVWIRYSHHFPSQSWQIIPLPNSVGFKERKGSMSSLNGCPAEGFGFQS